jgi:subtilisin family serine protease
MKSVRLLFLATLLVLPTATACNRNDDAALPAHDLPAPGEVSTYGGAEVFASQAVFQGDPARVEAYFQARGVSSNISPVDPEEAIYRVEFAPAIELAQVITDLRGSLEFIEPHYIVRAANNQNWPRDPEFINLWGLANYGQNAPGGVEGSRDADMAVLKAWQVTSGNPDIVVAVIDTGIDYQHPDLKANIWSNAAELKGSVGVDDDKNGYIDDVYGWDFVSEESTGLPNGQHGDNEPLDNNGHGTHCAGTIAAVRDNGIGIVGVAPGVRVMAVKFLNDQGSGSAVDAYRAIRYAVDKHANILSNSWGSRAKSQLIEAAIRRANESGVLVVAAAGNNGVNSDRNPSYPANYDLPNVVSVGASDNNDRPADFSNFGEHNVHVFAPGVNILSTVPTALSGKGRPYAVYSGTSMAAPHVAGVAALMLSVDAKLIGQPAAARQRLIATSEPIPALLGKSASGGRVSAFGAVKNQVNARPDGALVFEKYAYRSPRFPTSLTDDQHSIRKPGARAIKVHIAVAQIDEPYDSVWIYDSKHRLVMQISEGEAVDTWTPLIAGDSVKVRFVNSHVRQVTRKWETFPTAEEGYAKGAQICLRKADGQTFLCAIDGQTTEFFSSNSEGYEIDQIAYLPAEGARS